MSRSKSRTRRSPNVKAKIQDKECHTSRPRSRTRRNAVNVKAKIQDKWGCQCQSQDLRQAKGFQMQLKAKIHFMINPQVSHVILFDVEHGSKPYSPGHSSHSSECTRSESSSPEHNLWCTRPEKSD